MGKNVASQRISKIPILSIRKRNVQETKKLSYLESKKASDISAIRKTILKNRTNSPPQPTVDEIQKKAEQSPVQEFLRRMVRPDLPLCDIAKSVPITPRKTRSGKVFSRTSHFFGRPVNVIPRSESPISIGGAVTSTPIRVPTLPSVLLEGLMTAEEIDKTIDEVPNLDDINEPISLFDFAEAMRESLSPEIEKLSLGNPQNSENKENVKEKEGISETQSQEDQEKIETNECMKEIEKAFSMPQFADLSILKPMPVFAGFTGFKPLVEDSPLRRSDDERRSSVISQNLSRSNQSTLKSTDQTSKEEDGIDTKELNDGLFEEKSECVVEVSIEVPLSNAESASRQADIVECNINNVDTSVKEEVEQMIVLLEKSGEEILIEGDQMMEEKDGNILTEDNPAEMNETSGLPTQGIEEDIKTTITDILEVLESESSPTENEDDLPLEPSNADVSKESSCVVNQEEVSKEETLTETQDLARRRQSKSRGRKPKTKPTSSKSPNTSEKSFSPVVESMMVTRKPRRKTFFHQLPDATVDTKTEISSDLNSGNEDNQDYSTRSKRRNSIFPHQAIKRISAMHEDLDISESPKNKDSAVVSEMVKVIPIEVEEQENQNENCEPQDPTNPEPPISKRRKSARFMKKKVSPKAKEVTPMVMDVPKTTSPEPMEEDQTIAPVPPRFIVDGRVMVSMILPKDIKGKRKKVPGIPQTIEIDPTLLVEPRASCIKKDNANWGYQKYFRWADAKNERALEDVKEFTNEYQLRQSTYRKSFFKSTMDE